MDENKQQNKTTNNTCKEKENSQGKNNKGFRKNNNYKGKPGSESNVAKDGALPKQDPFWYAKDAKAIENMASFPWTEVVGSAFGETKTDCVPGILIAYFLPCFNSNVLATRPGGTVELDSNYATRAADTFYNYVAQGFSSSMDFEAPDLIMAALAAESLYTLICVGKRAYGATKYYLPLNQYWAKTIVNSLGIDFDDLRNNLADFRTQLNVRVDQINNLVAVPKQFFIGDRWEFLASNVFTDSTNPDYSTLFAYVPAKYLMYDPIGAKTGTSLVWKAPYSSGYNTSRMSVSDYFKLMDELIDALKGDDQRSMFGVIRRVYNDNSLKKATPLDKDYAISVYKHDVVSAMLHNSNWINAIDNVVGYAPSFINASNAAEYSRPIWQDASGNIVCCVAGLVSTDNYTLNDPHIAQPILVDMYDHLVNAGNVLDISNDMIVRKPDSTPITLGESKYAILSCRTEVLAQMTMFYFNATGESTTSVIHKTVKAASVNAAYLQKLSKLSHLDSHPLIIIVNNNGLAENYLGEIDRYTFLSESNIDRMNTVSQYTLLMLPQNDLSITK